MSYLAVDKAGTEFISDIKPYKTEGIDQYFIFKDVHTIDLPHGSIERLIGRKLTWEDEPVELTEDTLVKPEGYFER